MLDSFGRLEVCTDLSGNRDLDRRFGKQEREFADGFQGDVRDLCAYLVSEQLVNELSRTQDLVQEVAHHRVARTDTSHPLNEKCWGVQLRHAGKFQSSRDDRAVHGQDDVPLCHQQVLKPPKL